MGSSYPIALLIYNTMARKKTEFEVDGVVDQPQAEIVDGVPEFVDAILKVYRDQEELYVDKFGAAYTSNTPEHMRSGAILYKNKYFTK